MTPAAPGGQAPAGTPAKPESVAPPKPGTSQLESSPSPAKVTVTLPTDAALYVDDQLMKTTSDHRVFRTPDLDPSSTYYYILRAEVVRDGQRQSKTKQIIVRAGQDVQTSFPELESVSTASAQAALKP